MRILFIGDIFAKVGRDLVKRGVPALVRARDIDVVIANGENSAGGFGITREISKELFDAGIAVLTSGNHVWDKREILAFIDDEPRLLRPFNYPAGTPGRGSTVVTTPAGLRVGVLNLMGRVFMTAIDDPFTNGRAEVERLKAHTDVVFVDFHAEATSEKVAMGWHLDGLATAVVGTHTHVQTADAQVLPGGTAYCTDVGMTGPHDGVIGVERGPVISRFLTGLPSKFDTASGMPRLHGVIVTADASGRATAIERLSLTPTDIEDLG
ncbi:MAG: TIGR00282 family metallophosphoesterase [Acidobacteria bacterium]|nr:TIGR00282 family metallophosphoesterase [Acidobacteriota bacterium]